MRNSIGLFVVGFVLGFAPGAVAQVGTAADQLPDLSLQELLGVKVHAAARHEQRPFDSPRSVSVVTAEDIVHRGYRTVPEALSDVVGVVVQETTYGAGSPIIRGMIGNQILILVDGTRLNNAIYRIGPNQYLNTIDVNDVERIEIVRGPGSVLYGSDALGGLINIVTKSRGPDGHGFKAGGSIRAASADRSTTERLELSHATSRVGVFGGASLKRYGDVRGGGAVGLQPYTGYDEWAGDLKVITKLTDAAQLEASLQHLVQTDVDRTDLLLSGRNLQYVWNPQRRDLASVSFALKPSSARFVDFVSIVGSYQAQLERYRIVAAAQPTIRQSHDDGVGTAGLSVQISSTLPRQVATYGLDYYHDFVTSTRNDFDLTTGLTSAKTPTFANHATNRMIALFIQDEIELTSRVALALGVRGNLFDLHATVDDPLTGSVYVDSEPSALTGSAYALYRLSPRVHVTFGVGQGFRAPNANDTTVLGAFAGGFEIPNSNVRPEQVVEVKGGVKFQYPRFHGTATYYFTRYRDLISVAPTVTGDGLGFLDLNENHFRDLNEPDVYQRQNVGSARLQGVELEGSVRPADWLTVTGNVAWTRGDDLSAQAPLRRIPPVGGMVRINWLLVPRLRLVYQNSFAARQTRLNALDRSDPRIGPTGIPAFAVSTLRAVVDIGKRDAVSLTLDNLSDADYKRYSSGFKAPGFGVIVGYQRKL